MAVTFAAVTLLGIAGAFGVFMALIVGGLLGLSVVVGLTLTDMVKPDA